MRNTVIHCIVFCLIFIPFSSIAQDSKTVIYLIPGQGVDARQFNLLKLDPQFEVRKIEYFTPKKGWKMHEFARVLAQQIDTTCRFVIIGMSLGGILATEMVDFLDSEKIIFISSAKYRNELPGRYTFQNYFPIYKIAPYDKPQLLEVLGIFARVY